MAYESGWVIDRSVLVGAQNQLVFVIKKKKHALTKTVASQFLNRYVESKDASDWIRVDTRGECIKIDDYHDFLLVENPKSRVQLFWGNYKLFGYVWKTLCHTFTGFRHQEKVGKCDVVQVIDDNDDAIKPNIADSSFQGDVIAMVMVAALDRDFTHVLEMDVPWNVMDAAFAVIEGLGIKSKYWCVRLGEEYVQARMPHSLKQLTQMSQVPGSIKSAVLRLSVANLVDYYHRTVARGIDQQGMHLHEMNGCVTPSQTQLLQWIKSGIQSLSWNMKKEIVFDEIPAPAIIKCVEMLKLPCHACIDDLGLKEGVSALVNLFYSKNHQLKISKEIFDVWTQIWIMFKVILNDKEISNNHIWLMRVKYLITIFDDDYSEWMKAFDTLRNSPNCGSEWRWKYFVSDVIMADVHTKNYSNHQNKNECILAGVHALVDVLGKQNDLFPDHVSFMTNLMDWLYGIFDNDETLVVQEILKSVKAISLVSARLVIILQILRYFCVDSKQKVPKQLQILFGKHVPISFDYC